MVPETALPRIQVTRRYWYSSKYLEDAKWGKAPSKAEKSNLNIRYHKAAAPHLQPHGLTQRPAPARSRCSHTDNRNRQKENSNLRCSQSTGYKLSQLGRSSSTTLSLTVIFHVSAGQLHRAVYRSVASFALRVVQMENEIFFTSAAMTI